MAYIFDMATKTNIPLAPHHTFGRLSTAVNTHIDKPYVSKLHAAIEWNGNVWRIKNLGLNGTLINGIALEHNNSHILHEKDVFQFANLADAGFQIMDIAPPANMLWPIGPTQVAAQLHTPSIVQPIYLTGYHLLPDADLPEVAIYYDEHIQQWFLETLNQQHLRPLRSGDKIQTQYLQWQFISPDIYIATETRSQSLQQLNDFEFLFNLSLDEETTQLELHRHQQTVDLAVRSHHYLLLQLARHRATDAAKGLDSKSQGWIYTDQLGSELGLDPTHMNIHIFRLRKQLADNLPNTLGQQYLLERRGGKIRFGCEKFKIYKGATLTNELPLAQIHALTAK